jgi:GNAT superfamily N-acetyltransferase
MPTDICPVTRDLRDAAVGLLVRFFQEEGFTTAPARVAENLDRMVSDSSCWCALALVDGEARAAITVSTALYIEWGRLGEIGDLYVVPEYRRRGLAQRLIVGAMDWCRVQGCSAVSVTIAPTDERRDRLGRFYKRLGFALTGRTSAVAMLEP